MCKNLGLVGKVLANMEYVICLMQSWVITQLEFYRRVKFKHFCRNSSLGRSICLAIHQALFFHVAL